MANRLITFKTVSAAILVLSMTTAAKAGMYRFTDQNGQLVISNTIPQEATKRGYDILNGNGRVIDTIAPAPTEEEIAAREAKEQRQKALKARKEEDRKLLRRYSHPDQAVRAMHRKVRELESLVQLKRGNISVIASQLDSEQSRAADMERTGRDIPERTLDKIRRLESQIRDIEREIRSQIKELEDLRGEFKLKIKRLETITGETRTLPLEQPDGE